jgi:hypothetical protein
MADRDAIIRRSCVGVLACLIVTLLAGPNQLARAAPLSAPAFTVNDNSDAVASPPLNNGVCETAPGNGHCTLRAAIMKANNWPGGGVTIVLPALTAGGEYALILDQLTITSTMTIIGGGAANTIIDGSGITPTARVLIVESGAVTIGGVTIQGANAGGGGYGGGLAVLGDSALTLRDSIVTSNTAPLDGGGIFNSATLTVIDSLVSHNTAVGAGGGIAALLAVTTLSRVTVRGNTSMNGVGGGVYILDGPLDVVDSTISGNQAVLGGGMYNAGGLAVINSTVSGNIGGGIFNGNYMIPVSLSLYNATITRNQGGGIFNSSGGTFVNTVYLQNTLLDGNLDDCLGTVTSQGYNLFSTTAGCTISGGMHDLKNVPGKTGPLQNNGGPTFTNALLPGSPAIDAGNPFGCLDNLGATLHTDQRGAPRPADGAGSTICDIGAFELQRMLDVPLVFK